MRSRREAIERAGDGRGALEERRGVIDLPNTGGGRLRRASKTSTSLLMEEGA